MRPIGGELELKSNEYKAYFTDSGRSSLRLFFRSYDNRNKRYLLPNYFGKHTDFSKVKLDDEIVIEDNVFFHNFDNHSNTKNWFAFNSFRKISTLADGSLIKTNIVIDGSIIIKDHSKFSSIKYNAKDIKYSYINNGEFEESDYLNKFQQAEALLNNQKNIYTISYESMLLLLSQQYEQQIRCQRFHILKSLFHDRAILNKVDYYSFFIMKLDKRDAIRRKLMDKNIYLPIHWPQSTQTNNLYKSIVSIPLFETYNDNDFSNLIGNIKSIL